jgi:UDP-2,3-diacylglucosamine pyrophosphatase LpxH
MGKIIAVSDIHFGYGGSNWVQFERFLDILKKGELTARLHDKTSLQIKDIDKIILVGDIFDIWDPQDDKRMNILLSSITSLKKLLELNTEIIYVTGNHDEEMEMYKDERYLKGKMKFLGSYREKKKVNNSSGITTGYSYCFMHGHQFDKVFRYIGNFWRIPGLMASLDTLWQRVPIIRTPCIYGFPFIVALIPFDKYILDVYTSTFPYFLLALSWIVAIPAYWTRYQRPLYTLASRILKKIRAAFDKISRRIPSTGIVEGSETLQRIPFPKGLGEFLKNPSSFGTAKYKTITELVKRGYYKEEKEPETDVVVFGHTHEPEHVIFYDDNLNIKKIFINTGSWVINKNNLYTLAYIDTDKCENYLLKWDDYNKRLKEFTRAKRIKWSDGSYIQKQEMP